MKKTKNYWIMVSTPFNSGIRCSNCKHTMSARDAIFADKNIETCPWCEKEMDLSQIDWDRLKTDAAIDPKDVMS